MVDFEASLKSPISIQSPSQYTRVRGSENVGWRMGCETLRLVYSQLAKLPTSLCIALFRSLSSSLSPHLHSLYSLRLCPLSRDSQANSSMQRWPHRPQTAMRGRAWNKNKRNYRQVRKSLLSFFSFTSMLTSLYISFM